MQSDRDGWISRRAYELWQEGGRRGDTAERDWLEAERQHAAMNSADRSGPASDADTPSGAAGRSRAAKTSAAPTRGGSSKTARKR